MLRAWLKRSNLNQKDLAAQLRITDAFLSQLITGKRRAKLEILMLIEDITGVPVSAWADITHGKTDLRRKSRPNGPNKQGAKLECSELT